MWSVGRRFLERTIPIHVTITTIFLSVVAVISATLIWYNFERSREAAISAANQSLAEVTENILFQTRDLLVGFSKLTETASELPNVSERPSLRTHPAAPFILRLLNDHPQVNSAYMGFADGEFFQVFSLPADDVAKRATVGAPATSAFAVYRILRRADGKRVGIWQYLDDHWRVAGSTTEPEVAYDPRERPWYKAAIAVAGTIQTDLYVFRDMKSIGLTVARRFDGAIPGVFGADLTLYSLAAFLKVQGSRIKGIAVMFRSDGRLWAHPDVTTIETALAGADRTMSSIMTPHINNIGDPVLATMYRTFLDRGRGAVDRMEFEARGRPYLARVSSLGRTLGSDGFVAVVAPLDTFTGPYDAIRFAALVLSVLIAAVALPVVYFLSRRISRPLWGLVDEANAISRFDLGRQAEVHSRITEVRRLCRAMTSMKTALTTFTKFVPRTLVEQLIRSEMPIELGGVSREITIMFTDVANFTDMTERMPPENVMKKLSSYMEKLTGIILANNGTIDKFIGDAIMAFWNAPELDGDHVVRGCRAALLCRHRSEALNAEWESYGWEIMRTRFGLHTGETVVGTIGSSDRMNYTTVGANVNLAARLEGLNKYYGTQILVSAPVFERASHAFLFRPVDLVAPKGNAIAIGIHELIAAYPDGADGHAEIVADETQIAWAGAWTTAYQQYAAREWTLAREMFQELLGANPKDALAQVYVDRCDRYARQPPPDDWDGVERYHAK